MLGPEDVTDSLMKDFSSISETVQEMFGITPRCTEQIFMNINEGVAENIEYKMKTSYLEIYNE
eukprot:CAMPEP_0201282156 /NCGR_PEP_ID=MMETSP1317-20130820/4957_1 /ASSEMBLY_ACC=CAM_ASM_000770 /TAXON_ID=187299 /ORGANISM="Undescribed Undescribed, Strain Undescribed" /LENGTH=62 /DNA_ID=CAMNT_0047594081 /DNA_START=105 /DNA_END=293 /DNA_ORIENTATION=+